MRTRKTAALGTDFLKEGKRAWSLGAHKGLSVVRELKEAGKGFFAGLYLGGVWQIVSSEYHYIKSTSNYLNELEYEFLLTMFKI
ncbi:hypothetical protein ACEPP6_16555 [Bacillus rugosus]|uniref:hypothetical protein n=1 Tax=Bacillus rugosus TaxID=2715209 RepID=UPI0035A38677